MPQPPIAVFATKFVEGIAAPDDDPQDEVDCRLYANGAEAWPIEYGTDAHFLLYSFDGLDEAVRVNKSALPALADAGHEPHARWVALDLDNPDHREWETEDYDRLESLLTASGPLANLLDDAIKYQTRHGWRAVWPLRYGLPVSKYESFLSQFLGYLDGQGLGQHFDLDHACRDWTRMFRMPHVVRDGQPTRPAMTDFKAAPLAWAPDSLERNLQTSYGTESDEFRPEADPLDAYGAEQHDLDVAKAALDVLDPDVEYDTWLQVGMALKDGFHDGGFQLWRDWSADGDKAAENRPGELASKWRTFAVGGPDGVKFGTLVALATEEAGDQSWRPDPPIDEDARDVLRDAIGLPDHLRPEDHLIAYSLSSGSYWIWDERYGYYSPTIGNGAAFIDQLETRCPSLLGGRHVNDKGRPYSTATLLRIMGTEVHDVVAQLGQQGVVYEWQHKRIAIGRATVDPTLEAREHPKVQEWLIRLGAERSGELLDWLATFLDFDQPTCALYIDGPNSVGKGLLAAGIARLFGRSSAVPWSEAMSSFNAAIADCPLVVADEQVPDNMFSEDQSQAIKRFLGDSGKRLNEKYQPKQQLSGIPRLLITANDDDAFTIYENVSEETRRAIERRIGYIETDEAAQNYLEQLGGYKTTQSWVDGGKIAEHILWLRDQREVDRGTRFIVEGWPSKFTANLGARHGLTARITAVLIEYIMQSETPHDRMPYGLDVSEGARERGVYLQVNAPTLQKVWDKYDTADEDEGFSQNKMARALRSLAVGKSDSSQKSRIRTPAGAQARVWNLSVEPLVQNCAGWNLYDVGELLDALDVSGPERERLLGL